MPRAKPAKKSAPKTAPGRPFQRGGDPRQGRGPRKGAPNAGRPPDEFKQMLAHLASRDATVDALETILSDPDHPAFMKALDYATERGYGKAPQAVEHSGSLATTGPALTVVVASATPPASDGDGRT